MSKDSKPQLEEFEIAIITLMSTKSILNALIHSTTIQISYETRLELLQELAIVEEKLREISG